MLPVWLFQSVAAHARTSRSCCLLLLAHTQCERAHLPAVDAVARIAVLLPLGARHAADLAGAAVSLRWELGAATKNRAMSI